MYGFQTSNKRSVLKDKNFLSDKRKTFDRVESSNSRAFDLTPYFCENKPMGRSKEQLIVTILSPGHDSRTFYFTSYLCENNLMGTSEGGKTPTVGLGGWGVETMVETAGNGCDS